MQAERKSVCGSDLCLSIHISEFCLPYTLSEIHRHTHAHHLPHPQCLFLLSSLQASLVPGISICLR